MEIRINGKQSIKIRGNDMGKVKKYISEEEKKKALKQYAKEYYAKRKNDPTFITARKYYYLKYKKGLSQTRKDFMRNYNTDYVYYVRNIITGKFEKKIAETKEQAKMLDQKIKEMESRKQYLEDKFGHLHIKIK